jgi:hypothetical protein
MALSKEGETFMLMAMAPMTVGACRKYERDSRFAILDGRLETIEDTKNGETTATTAPATHSRGPRASMMALARTMPGIAVRRNIDQAEVIISFSSILFLDIQSRVGES